MGNYCVFIVLWSAWVILVVAWVLAVVLGKAFRGPLPPTAPVDAAEPVSDGRGPSILAYAPPRVKRSIVGRWPWLAGMAALGLAVVLLGALLVPPMLAFAVLGVFRPHAYAAMAVSLVAVVAAPIVTWRGVRRVGGIPAAASWPGRRLRKVCICGMLVLVATWIALDMGTKYRLLRVRGEMIAQAQQLYVPVPAGTENAADTYREVFPLLGGVPDWVSRYSPGDPAPTAPPTLSAELEGAVRVLHRASRLPVADWGTDPTTSSITTLLPHLAKMRSSTNLLRIHAASEAQAGRIENAIRDIQVIHAMARHVGQGQLIVESLVAIGMDVVGYASTQDVLPFIRDERRLDELRVTSDGWQKQIRGRMIRGEEAFSVRLMIDCYNGNVAWTSVVGGRRMGGPSVRWLRAFLADLDVTGMRDVEDKVAVAAERDAAQAVEAIRQLDEQIKDVHYHGGIMTAIIQPSVSRPVQKGVEAEVLGELANVGLAVRRMYLRTGRLPGTLEELVAEGLLERVPMDPFSGMPIRMKIRPGEIIIYSVGLDGRDDSGDCYQGKDVTFRVGIRALWELDQVKKRAIDGEESTTQMSR